MKFTRKNIILFIIMGIVAYSFPVISLCSSHCLTVNPDINSSKDVSCSISSHSFVQFGVDLSILIILPLVSLFVVIKKICIPTGFFFPPFRPPKPLY